VSQPAYPRSTRMAGGGTARRVGALGAALAALAGIAAGPPPPVRIGLDGGGTLVVREVEPHRGLPHAFYDQALASLPRLHPEHVLLAARRRGTVAGVAYALVCYREAPDAERVVIQASAVHGDRAWSLDAVVPPPYGSALLQVVEEIAKLPSRAEKGRPADR